MSSVEVELAFNRIASITKDAGRLTLEFLYNDSYAEDRITVFKGGSAGAWDCLDISYRVGFHYDDFRLIAEAGLKLLNES